MVSAVVYRVPLSWWTDILLACTSSSQRSWWNGGNFSPPRHHRQHAGFRAEAGAERSAAGVIFLLSYIQCYRSSSLHPFTHNRRELQPDGFCSSWPKWVQRETFTAGWMETKRNLQGKHAQFIYINNDSVTHKTYYIQGNLQDNEFLLHGLFSFCSRNPSKTFVSSSLSEPWKCSTGTA